MSILSRASIVFALLLAASTASAAEPALTLHPLQGPAVRLTLEQIREAGSQMVEAAEHGGAISHFRCAPLAALLERAGIALGRSLSGKRLAGYLQVRSRDGYTVVFALPELEAAFTERQIFLCDARDGAPLSADEGPLRLVIPAEKRHGRWARQVTEIYEKSSE